MLAKFIDRPWEDSLTAAVIGHLLHLPIEMAWGILKKACGSLPDCPGEPFEIHYWPSWDATGTRRTDRVIPDLFIEFSDFDLIIEAKRWDCPMQDRDQWQAELRAYLNVYGDRQKPVKMLALGGVHAQSDDEIKEPTGDNAPTSGRGVTCPVYMCQWSSLLLECQRSVRRLRAENEIVSATRAHIRILDDLIELFAHHSFRPLQWSGDFSFGGNFLSPSFVEEQSRFIAASQRYSKP